jgi:hypothetical protein
MAMFYHEGGGLRSGDQFSPSCNSELSPRGARLPHSVKLPPSSGHVFIFFLPLLIALRAQQGIDPNQTDFTIDSFP